jgi:hypothetical protein
MSPAAFPMENEDWTRRGQPSPHTQRRVVSKRAGSSSRSSTIALAQRNPAARRTAAMSRESRSVAAPKSPQACPRQPGKDIISIMRMPRLATRASAGSSPAAIS